MRKLVIAGLTGAALMGAALFGLAACGNKSPAEPSGDDIANTRQNYSPTSDVEGRNYNARQRLADQPSTLLWCTAFPTSPNAKAFTVPIVGKLTSGNKRPYSTTQTIIDNDTGSREYSSEKAGPDGMFGTSGEYRYGFDPAGNYHDFYNLETYCTNVPNIVQREQTTIVIASGADPAALDRQVEAALKDCIERAGKDDKGNLKIDPSKPCPEAARLLGES